MSRRPRLSSVPVRGLLVTCLVGLLSCLPGCRRSEPPKNLILITIDTLRADRLSLYGYDRETSPNIDRWASRGMVFDRAWSVSSWTLPSMNMLLTGQVQLNNSGRVLDEQIPIAEHLSKAGFQTAAVIANGLLRPALNYDRGFDSFEKVRPKKGRKVYWDGRDVMDRGMAWLEARDERPFFLFLHFIDPHAPYQPKIGNQFEIRNEPENHERMKAVLSDEDRARLDQIMYLRIEGQRSMYESEVLYADGILGELFDYLERTGLDDSTVVVLTADHGEGLWQRPPPEGDDAERGSLFQPLYQAHGGHLFSEQVHVPLIVRGPGIPAGREERDVSLLDVTPTLYRLLGIDVPRRLSGQDLFAPAGNVPIFGICSRGLSVTVDGRWRLHKANPLRAAKFNIEPELFDIVEDPEELHPIDDPARIAELSALIDDWMARYEHTIAVPVLDDPSLLQDLRDLGYAGEAERLEGEIEKARAEAAETEKR